jgi:hypothetical protein
VLSFFNVCLTWLTILSISLFNYSTVFCVHFCLFLFLFSHSLFLTWTSICFYEQVIDLISAVKELHGLSSQELNKLLRDSENFTIHFHSEKGSTTKVRKQAHHQHTYAFLFYIILHLKSHYFSDWCGKTGRLSSFTPYCSAYVIW